MTSDYSIDLESEKIYMAKTKEYFEEVLSSYISGNYRSAIVVLWTVTVVDLVLKLQELVSIYEDETAKKILEDIKKSQDSNTKSPVWEKELIDIIEKRTDMFEVHEIVNIKSLQQHRHLSAHPIINNSLELFQPNKETARAHIRNILESVLTKPPLASNKIFNTLLNDISMKKDLFPNLEDLQHYIKEAYLKKMPKPVVKFIFKKLWKFTFKSTDDKCSQNRVINLRALAVIIREYRDIVSQLISEDNDYYGNNIALDDNKILMYFHTLMSKYSFIYFKLKPTYLKPIKQAFKREKELYITSRFIFDDNKTYIEMLKENLDITLMSKDNIEDIVEASLENDFFKELIDFFITKFINSSSYDEADIIFSKMIEPYLKEMSKENIIDIIKGIDRNSQLSDRRRAKEDNTIIYQVATEVVDDNFDLFEYDNFISNCNID